MPFPDDEEIALPLVRRSSRPSRPANAHEDEVDALEERLARRSPDRLGPGIAGALTGALGGLAAYATIVGLSPALAARAAGGIARLVPALAEAAPFVAFATAAAIGALVGALFGAITRHLRRWVPMLTWSLVVFPTIVVALLALQRTYLPRAHFLAPVPLVVASVAFAVVWSLEVRLRVRHTFRSTT